MASFIDCLLDHFKDGKISKDDFDRLKTTFDDQYGRFKEKVGDDKAREFAMQFAEQEVDRILEERRLSIMQSAKNVEVTKEMQRIMSEHGAKATAAFSAIINDADVGKERWAALFYQALDKFFDEYKPRWVGNVIDNATLQDAIGHMLGKTATTNNGKILGESLRKMFDEMQRQYVRFGGTMRYLKNYFPTFHDSARISRVSRDEWVEFVSKHIDEEKMIDFESGELMNPEQIKQTLEGIYDNIANGGVVDRSVPDQTFFARKTMAQRREYSKVLHWKDADSFFAYNEKFGRGNKNLIAAFHNYVMSISRDISIMQKLGPDPYSAQRAANNLIARDAETDIGRKLSLDGQFKVLMGLGGDNNGVGTALLNGFFTHQRIAKLGSAMLAAFTDIGFSLRVGLRNDFGGFMTNIPIVKQLLTTAIVSKNYFKGVLSAFIPAKVLKSKDMLGAKEALGFHYMSMFGGAMASTRFTAISKRIGRGGGGAVEKTISAASMLTDNFYKLNGLEQITNGGRNSMVFNTLQGIQKSLSREWDDLPEDFRKGFALYDITREDFEFLKSHAAPGTSKNNKWFDPRLAREASDDNPLWVNAKKQAQAELAGPEPKIVNKEIVDLIDKYIEAEVRYQNSVDTSGGSPEVRDNRSQRGKKAHATRRLNMLNKKGEELGLKWDDINALIRERRSGVDLTGTTRSGVDLSGPVQKFLNETPNKVDPSKETFSGELNTIHFSGDSKLKTFKDPAGVDDSVRYDDGDSVLGKQTYFSEDARWSTAGISASNAYGVRLNFNKAFVLTPKTLGKLKSVLGLKELDLKKVPELLKAKGYDGLIMKGWDEVAAEVESKYGSRINKKVPGWIELAKKQAKETQERMGVSEKNWMEYQNQIVSFEPQKNASIVKPLPADEALSLGKAQNAQFEKANSRLVHNRAKDILNDIVLKFEKMADANARIAINQPDTLTRAIVTGGLPAGSWQRNSLAIVADLKTFGINVIHAHFWPAVMRAYKQKKYDEITAIGLISYLVAYWAVNPLQDLFSGKTPESHFDEDGSLNQKKHFRALKQAGTAGLLSDAIFTPLAGYNFGVADMIVGPTGSEVLDTVQEQSMLLSRDFEDDEYMKEATRLGVKRILRNIPFQNLFYGKLLLERKFNDPLMMIYDEDWDKRQKRTEQRMSKRGQEWWWAPGEEPDFDKLQESVEDMMFQL